MKFVSYSMFLFLINMYNVGRTNTQQNVIRIPLSRADPRLEISSIPIPKYYQILEDTHNVHMGEISIGSPPQSYRVVFDTQSNRPWVFSASFRSCDVYTPYMKTIHRTFDQTESITFSQEEEPIPELMKYDLSPAWVFGFKSNDSFSIAGKEINTEFIKIMKSSIYKIFGKHDGSIGLQHASSKRSIVTQLCDEMKAENKFSFYLSRNNQKPESEYGELMLCGEDQTKYVPGTMQYVKDIKPGHWKIQVARIEMDWGNETSMLASKVKAFVDTSTDLIIGPLANVTMFHNRVKAKPIRVNNKEEGDFKQVDCATVNSLPKLKFQISNKTYELSGTDYTREIQSDVPGEILCNLLVRNSTSDDWIIGESFIRKYYTVFDVKNRKIGFATTNES